MPELTPEDFRSTFSKKMIDVTDTADADVDIWPYVEELADEKNASNFVPENSLVKVVYRNSASTYDHVLLPTEKQNIFLVIVVDLLDDIILGHYWMDIEKEYGLK